MRAVAMAALADQFSTPATPSSPSIPAPLYYALFRAGLPANAQTLYRADLGTVGAIWNAAITQGVIPAAMSDQLTAALATFHQMSATAILDAVTIANASSLRAMLQVTLGTDTQRQQEFATLYTQYQTDMTSFWAAVTKSFGDATSKKLQLDGQLAFLTLNNAPLMTNVYKAEQFTPITSLLDLVRRGYYQASKWTPLMTDGTQTDLIALIGVDSAYAIAHYGHDAFIRAFTTSVGSAEVAAATFVTVQSVYNAVLNVTTDYLIRRVTPALGNGTSKYLGPFPKNNKAIDEIRAMYPNDPYGKKAEDLVKAACLYSTPSCHQ
jgi:hypothetical protein